MDEKHKCECKSIIFKKHIGENPCYLRIQEELRQKAQNLKRKGWWNCEVKMKSYSTKAPSKKKWGRYLYYL